MQFWLISLYGVGVLLGFSSAAEIYPWANMDPSEWSDNYPECGGQKQSPIFLDKVNSTMKPSDPDTTYEIKFENIEKKGNVTAVNNGFNMVFNYTYSSESERPRITTKYNGTSNTYYVFSTSFNWPGEHKKKFKWSLLELHIFGKNDKGDEVIFAYLFATYVGAYCIRFPCEASCIDDDNISLERETKVALSIPKAGDVVNYEDSLGHLLPKNRQCGYFFYEGSYTIPPCKEGVLWFVYKRIICIEEETMKAVKSMEDAYNEPILSNNRPRLDRNGRRIIYFRCDIED
ncbi:hypothetical protein R5R35_014226 [Gryllus longicercus]|uniref:carbonic anhydrase n=1 Tax=Gryllus longicercus TaxID=2509291 RepID=A0AAN9ZAH6_9ORTH